MAVMRRARATEWLLPAALTVFLSFNAGGYFPTETAFAAVALAVFLVLRFTLAEEPFAGFSRPLALAAGGLALLGVWQLASSAWSGAPARALLEFDLTLLYLLALLTFGSFSYSARRMRRIAWGVALGMALPVTAGLITRLLPTVWPTAPNVANERLSYPFTYWNALGLAAAIAALLCLHLTSSTREPRTVRVLGAAAVPVLATALYFTFSRGAIVAGLVGLVVYVLAARTRTLLPGLLATVVPAAFAVRAGYGADLLASRDPTTPAAVAQGREVAGAVAMAVVGAAAVRAALLPLDKRLAGLDLSGRYARGALAGAAALAVVATIGAAAALDLPTRASDGLERFVAGNQLESTGDLRDRLTQAGNNGRIYHWRVALDGFRDDRVKGYGAGTYQMLWAERRPSTFSVQDAHSLYLEVLAELGGVGLVLLALALAPPLAALTLRSRGGDRAVHGALLGAAVAWAVHAGIDWDWEMPAVTLWLFCAGGAALAATPSPGGGLPAGRRTRVFVAIGVLLVAVTPALMAVSQWRLDQSTEAFVAGRCPQAVDAALASIAVVGVRAEPWEILGYCDVRLGERRLAVDAMENAVERDPANWEYHYALALARGAARLDPRPEVRRALALNPREKLLQRARERFATNDPRTWERRAVTARLSTS